MNICYFYRKKGIGFSIERVFKQIRAAMPVSVKQSEFYCSYSKHKNPSTYIRNILDAKKHSDEINHITGDINYVALGLPPERTIITIHDIGHAYNSNSGVKGFLLRQIFMQRPFNRAKYLVAISNFTKNEVVKKVGIPPEKIRVIYDPAPSEFSFTPQPFNRRYPRILCFCHMQNKNLTRHIAALDGIPCHLRIIGNIPKDDELLLKKLNFDYSNIYNLTDEQIFKEYRDCDLLLFASTYEGFGVPVLEAQLTGRPVITSNIPPLDEVVNGDSALLSNPFDTLSIRNNIKRILESDTLANDLVCKGLENVARFSPAKIASDYTEVYEDILK